MLMHKLTISLELHVSGTNTECQGRAPAFSYLSSSNLQINSSLLYIQEPWKIYSLPVVQNSLRLNLCHLCIIAIIQKSNILCQHKRKENKLISLNNKYKMLQDIHQPSLSSQAMLDPVNTGKLPKALSEMNRSLAIFLQNLLYFLGIIF